MRTLLILCAVLILVLVGVDIGGRALAEAKAGEALATRAHLSKAPGVTIHGLSFLAQALPGSYSKITITAQDLTLGQVSGVAATIDLYEVSLLPGEAVAGDLSRLSAGVADLRVTIPTSAIGAALHRPGLTVTPGPAGTLRVGTAVTVLGRAVPITADLGVTLSAGTLQLRAGTVQAAGISSKLLPISARDLAVDIPLGNLPIPVSEASVAVNGAAVEIDARVVGVAAGSLR